MVMVAGTFGFVPHLNFCHKCIVHSLMYQDSKYRGRESDRNAKTKRRKEPVGGDASLPCVAELACHTAGNLRKFCDFQPKMDVKRVTARSRSAVGKTRKAALPPSSRPRRFTVEEDCAYNNFPT